MSGPMFDLSVGHLDDGTIRLEQRDYCGESYVVDLHPCQLRHIAERAGLLGATPKATIPANLLRRVRALYGRIDEFYRNEFFFDEIFDRCGDGPEMWLHIRAIFEMADEIVAELDTYQANDDDGQQRNGKESALDRNENPSALSVTDSGETWKPGRPATGDAMSNAERQAKFRERQKAPEPQQLQLEPGP